MKIGISTTVTARSADLAEVARLVKPRLRTIGIPQHPVIPLQRSIPFPASTDGQMPEHYMQWADPFIALTVAATVPRRSSSALGSACCRNATR